MRILVAEDDPVVREVVRRYLERDGTTVTEAADGVQAERADAATRSRPHNGRLSASR
ncbi:CheY-like chemotaxis protein [Nocardia kruczakiae]|uniref:CheY-like chemotaxis protein n=1 Tax=Nocardia kruczakiae TaxID=261477 RepID=A0ABU1XAG8_9NOCA|nr:response regulator [Nocardia kruczakiae]MDR7167057.1 CheY-like chemotaxis protein [Nocardia kruczakiae]